ncbi:MAG: hypothetical protein LAT58_09350 [Opitutales bacterium]|nr:hypothetical protein [Opitutales bacterium]
MTPLRLFSGTLFCLFIISGAACAGNPSSPWEAAQEALSEALPQTAMAEFRKAEEAAVAEGEYGRAMEALLRRVQLQHQREGNPLVVEKEIREAVEAYPPEWQAIGKVVAVVQWQNYFQQNRWRFQQRTDAGEAEGEGPEAWSLPRMLREIDQRWQEVLADGEILAEHKIETLWELDFMSKGTVAADYYPTWYDLALRTALEFYQMGEQGGLLHAETFRLDAGDPVFGSREAFLSWDLEEGRAEDPLVRAVVLLQEGMRFHQERGHTAALADMDLLRIRFGWNQASGESKGERYAAALERLAEAGEDREITAWAWFELATWYREEEENFVQARELGQKIVDQFADTVVKNRAERMIIQIETPALRVQTEFPWNPRLENELRITYRNLEKVHFRLIPFSWEDYLTWQGSFFRTIPGVRYGDHLREGSLGRERLLAMNPVKTWSLTLPTTEDFQEKTHRSTAGKDLDKGFYLLLAAAHEDFSFGSRHAFSPLYATPVQVSELGMMIRTTFGGGSHGGLVVDGYSGEPVPGAHWQAMNLEGGGQIVKEGTSDEDGLFSFSPLPRGPYLWSTEFNEDFLFLPENWTVWNYHRSTGTREVVRFFTDRSLYRPGQTIHFKGIVHRHDRDEEEYRLLDNERYTVVLRDANRQEVSRKTVRTNDFGSFAGAFVAPREGLTGNVSLSLEGRFQGSAGVSVEEYKRPQFRVTMDPPKGEPRLGEIVEMTGEARAYTGAAVGRGTVEWQVVRDMHFSPWRFSFRGRSMPQSRSQVIANGTGETRVDGSFDLSFEARPDPTISPEDNPVFSYRIQVSVTDGSGETRSQTKTVRLAYHAIEARVFLPIEGWVEAGEPFLLQIQTTDHASGPVSAEGVVKVFALQGPEIVPRKDIFANRWDDSAIGQQLADWEAGELVQRVSFETSGTGLFEEEMTLAAGAYRAVLQAVDRYGETVEHQIDFVVPDRQAETFTVPLPSYFETERGRVRVGEDLRVFWGTGYSEGRALIEILDHRGVRKAYWTDPGSTQHLLTKEITEDLRGGFLVQATFFRENRWYQHQQQITVPWDNKDLQVSWETFRSELEPGEKQRWRIRIEGPDGTETPREMVAALYDASLDQFRSHSWPENFGVFNQLRVFSSQTAAARQMPFEQIRSGDLRRRWGDIVSWEYPSLAGWLLARPHHHRMMMRAGEVDMVADEAAPEVVMESAPAPQREEGGTFGTTDEEGRPEVDLEVVSLRRNLEETAFFVPQLQTDEEGMVEWEFTMPEALTEWRFMAYAHDQDLRSGYLEDTVITSRELMARPLAPRFVREGDTIRFPVQVNNQSRERVEGQVRLEFFRARDMASRDEALGNEETVQSFSIPAEESRTFFWEIELPEGEEFLVYRTVASSRRVSDGEEGYLPVLPRRILLTESLPLPLRGEGERSFAFASLLGSGESDTLRHLGVTVQMTSQPAWLAVLSLPYLMESEHRSADAEFRRFYANQLAAHIAQTDPKVERVFRLWKAEDAEVLKSPLERNEDLRQIALEETPWLRRGQDESERRQLLGNLFQKERLAREGSRAMENLAEWQGQDGLWPWFPGGRGSSPITLSIVTGFGKLQHLGVGPDLSLARKAWAPLDQELTERYERLKERGNLERVNLGRREVHQLYARSFFQEQHPVEPEHREAYAFWLEKALEDWTRLDPREMAQLALVYHRMVRHRDWRSLDRELPERILRSLREQAFEDEELGIFWSRANEFPRWLGQPVEEQAVMIEAFEEIADDQKYVDGARTWLLKQRQVQAWRTTRETADAVYALLRRGSDWLASDELVRVRLGDKWIEPEGVEAGTGFYEKSFPAAEVRSGMGDILTAKPDEGVSWGSVHWHYWEDLDEIKAHTATPLQVEKQLLRRQTGPEGSTLVAVDGPLEVGQEVVSRLVIRVDRDMDFVHLKDRRGSGLEPVNVLSGHRSQDGLWYYESTRDTASHFYFERLPRGTHVFEYSNLVRHRGEFSSGIATLQSFYAPEFNSHSEAVRLSVE